VIEVVRDSFNLREKEKGIGSGGTNQPDEGKSRQRRGGILDVLVRSEQDIRYQPNLTAGDFYEWPLGQTFGPVSVKLDGQSSLWSMRQRREPPFH